MKNSGRILLLAAVALAHKQMRSVTAFAPQQGSASASSSSSSVCSRLRMSIPNYWDITTSGMASLLRLPTGVKLSREVGRLQMSIPNGVDTATSGLASIFRLPAGVKVSREVNKTDDASEKVRLKALYDVENSIPCKMVRELITELDLVVENVVPSTPGSRVFTDPNFKYSLFEGMEIPRLVVVTENEEETTYVGVQNIVEFFATTFPLKEDKVEELVDEMYNQNPITSAIDALQTIGGYLSYLVRIGRGTNVTKAIDPNARPEKPLILYSYEGNQFCRLVREVLTELDIVYELRSAGKGSPRRYELAEITGGSTQCPYLLDPNTGMAMDESADIIEYLYDTYARWTPPNEVLQWTSKNVMSLVAPLFRKLTPLQAGKMIMASSGNSNEVSDAAADVEYKERMTKAKAEIEEIIQSNPVVVYTYTLSPFSSETKTLLDRLQIEYKEVSLGAEWIPGLINEGGAQTRAALLEMTGQSSLPHIFIGGKSIGGLFTGTPGLVPALEQDILMDQVQKAVMEKQQQQQQ